MADQAERLISAPDKYRPARATIEFTPEQFEVFGETVANQLGDARSIATFVTATEAFLEAAESLHERRPQLLPRKDIVGPARQISSFGMNHLDIVRRAVDRARQKGPQPETGVYDCTTPNIQCSVSLPYDRQTDFIWLEAVSTVTPQAVVSGHTRKNNRGYQVPERPFAAVIDYTLPRQDVSARYGRPFEERINLVDAMVSSLAAPKA